jgi:hypothetical protein
VEGQLGREDRGRLIGQLWPLGKCPGIASVQFHPLAGQQIGVDHLTEQGVTDVIAVPTSRRHQQLVRDRSPQPLD